MTLTPINIFAKAVAVSLHPLLLPIYCTILTLYGPTPYHVLGSNVHIHILLLMGIYACLCPLTLVGAFMVAGVVKELEMPTKRERIIPLLAISFAMMMSLFIIDSHQVPRPLLSMICGESILLFITALCTIVWRISLHAVGGGALVGYVCSMSLLYHQDFIIPILFAIVAAGLIGWARLHERLHTLRQVMGGYLVGLTVMSISVLIIMIFRLL